MTATEMFREPESGAWIGMRVSRRGDVVELANDVFAQVVKGDRLQYWPIPSAVAGLLVCLSIEGPTWTEERRAHWLRVFTLTLDYALPGLVIDPASRVVDDCGCGR